MCVLCICVSGATRPKIILFSLGLQITLASHGDPSMPGGSITRHLYRSCYFVVTSLPTYHFHHGEPSYGQKRKPTSTSARHCCDAFVSQKTVHENLCCVPPHSFFIYCCLVVILCGIPILIVSLFVFPNVLFPWLLYVHDKDTSSRRAHWMISFYSYKHIKKMRVPEVFILCCFICLLSNLCARSTCGGVQ